MPSVKLGGEMHCGELYLLVGYAIRDWNQSHCGELYLLVEYAIGDWN
jgi:hypothetical protein